MLKPIEPQSTATVVWHADPAFEPMTRDETMKFVEVNMKSFVKGRELLTVKSGSTPTEFRVGVIPPSVLARIESDALWGSDRWRMNEMYWDCFVAGLRDVKNSGLGKTPKVERNGVEYVDPDWLEATFVRSLRGCGLFIGRMIWAWNIASDDDIKN
jgi:hypothetical protein